VTGETSILRRCPDLRDTRAAMRILRHIGCRAERTGGNVIVCADAPTRYDIPADLMREMRSSIIFLGALVALFGRAELSSPGGCAIGLRPIDIHLSAMETLGVRTTQEGGQLLADAPAGILGGRVTLPFPSVGATENVMLCAVRGKGQTVIHNAAREPEVRDLAQFLNACGADVRGAGSDTVTIEPTSRMRACEYTILPDRIAAATYMAAAAMTGGELVLREADTHDLLPVLPFFEQSGCRVTAEGDTLHLRAPRILTSPRPVRTMPYPGFPTDFQAVAMAMASVSEGTGVFIETIFESRFKHVPQLIRMGARITVQNNVAVVEGVPVLRGAPVQAADLRGGAALVCAGLAAHGRSEVQGVCFIDRGYERMEDQLTSLGAAIRRIQQHTE
jgi:UDP-N-acetylglucosamine 1-carboxyvinyltransferase